MLTSLVAAGCSNGGETATEAAKSDSSDETAADDSGDADSGSSSGGMTAAKATKLSTVRIADADSVTLTPGGAIYKVGQKYGIASLDGQHDTGAIYMYAQRESTTINFSDNSYTMVFADSDKEDDVNICGLVDSACTVVIEP